MPVVASVAIVGLHGVLPGSADVATFWQHLDDSRSLLAPLPDDRFDPRRRRDVTTDALDGMWGGYMPEIRDFDCDLFGITPDDAAVIDPQQRLLLMSAWQTLEDAGYDRATLAGSRTGVFVAVEDNEYLLHLKDAGIDLSAHGLNHHQAMIANRISHFFDFAGPSEIVNTMCSGAAVAIHRAVHELRAGTIDQALVGAARVILRPEWLAGLRRMGVLSDETTVRSFAEDARGFLRSEGVGSVLLKPLPAAERDGDHVYAVIRNTGVNYNGRGGMSIAAPSKQAHAELIARCYEQAGVDPRDVGYIEAQGMGNPVADLNEWAALNTALRRLCAQRGVPFTPGFCRVSTLKPMIGHMDCASALGALFKIIHSLRAGRVFPILGLVAPSRSLELAGQPCRLVTETEAWPATSGPRLAGLHSFGAGGVNAHVLLEAYDEPAVEARPGIGLLPLSAMARPPLEANLRNLIGHLERHPDVGMERVAYALQTGRASLPCRLVFVGLDRASFLERARAWLAGAAVDGIYEGTVRAASASVACRCRGRWDLRGHGTGGFGA